MIALFDDIVPQENMKKFVFKNDLSLKDFWKNWHSSYHDWVERYIYIPAGGKNRKLLSFSLVFLFTAIWHSFDLNLLNWALVSIFSLAAENFARTYFEQEKVKVYQFQYISFFCFALSFPSLRTVYGGNIYTA